MPTKIKRADCLEKYPVFPTSSYDYEKEEENTFYPKISQSYILTHPSKSFRGHLTILGKEMEHLAQALQSDKLIFLGEFNTPWFRQNNEYRPVKRALDYLVSCNVGKRFDGALQVETGELPVFVRHFGWLVRCNAALPYFHFIDAGQNIVGHICKYGSLHLDPLNATTDNIIRSFVESSRLIAGDHNSCYNWAGKTSAIPGRQTIV